MNDIDSLINFLNNQNGGTKTTDNSDYSKKISIIKISPIFIEKINQNLEKACEFHDENRRKSFFDAANHFAGN